MAFNASELNQDKPIDQSSSPQQTHMLSLYQMHHRYYPQVIHDLGRVRSLEKCLHWQAPGSLDAPATKGSPLISRSFNHSNLNQRKHSISRKPVEHRYEDHALDPLIETKQTVLAASNSHIDTTYQPKQARQSRAMLFPERLHCLLTHAVEEGVDDVISWQPHGRCFSVHKPDDFTKTVLPRHFRHGRMTSFQRQLSLYGFIRLTKGFDSGGYYHPFFLQGRPDLASKISRTTVKGIGVKSPYNPRTEPDFYKMPPCVISSVKDRVVSVISSVNDGRVSLSSLNSRCLSSRSGTTSMCEHLELAQSIGFPFSGRRNVERPPETVYSTTPSSPSDGDMANYVTSDLHKVCSNTQTTACNHTSLQSGLVEKLEHESELASLANKEPQHESKMIANSIQFHHHGAPVLSSQKDNISTELCGEEAKDRCSESTFLAGKLLSSASSTSDESMQDVSDPIDAEILHMLAQGDHLF